MKIEGNQKELDAMVEFHKGNRVEGLRLQEEFAAEFRKEYKDKDHCPCLKACRYHGNCKECVAIHRAHQEHVPNCMRSLINKKLKLMSELTEHTLANEIESPHEILRKDGMKNAIEIRCIRENELGLLKDFLYEAIFIPEGVEPPSRDIVEKPELRVYTDGFGTKSGDNCLVAIHDGKIVGAVWTRIMNDYGHVDDETPSFAISLYKEYRRKGIGTRLMEEMLEILRDQGYKRVSLAVQKANYAVKMYQKTGFRIMNENDEEFIMVCEL